MAKTFDPEIGKNTRWRKGQRSPNPGGRPRYGLVSAYLRQALEGGDADKIARSLLKLAKNGNMRAISEVIDRTEGKATQTMEVAVEKSERDSTDWRDISPDELAELFIDSSVNAIRMGLEGLDDEHLVGEVRKVAPTLRELHEKLTNLIETLDDGGIPCALEGNETVENDNKGIEPAKRSCWRTERIGAGGGMKHVYIGP